MQKPRKNPTNNAEQVLLFQAPDDPEIVPAESILHPAFDECDDESLLELDASYWDALLLDDDDAGLPEEGDFWLDQDAA